MSALSILFAACIAILLAVASAHAQTDLHLMSPQVAAIMRGAIVDDVSGYLAGNDALVEWKPNVRAQTAINARALAHRYSENEVAGDQLIKNKRVLLSGVLVSVRRDNMGNQPVAQLDGGGLIPVQAGMTDDADNIAATYKTGQNIQLLCEDGGHKMMVGIRLNGCRDYLSVRDPIIHEAQQSVTNWLQTGTLPPYQTANKVDGGDGWRGGFFYMYWMAKNLPANSVCLKPGLEDAQAMKCFQKTALRKLKPQEVEQFRNSYLAEQSFLHLPAPGKLFDNIADPSPSAK